MKILRWIIFSSIVIWSVPGYSQISMDGVFSNACIGQNFTYRVITNGNCASIMSINCRSCDVISRAADNQSITVRWKNTVFPNPFQPKEITASAVCTEGGITKSYSFSKTITLSAQVNEVYFCTMEAISGYTTPQTAPESTDEECETTAYPKLLSYVNFTGTDSPFMNFNTDVNVGFASGDGGNADISLKWRPNWRGQVTIEVFYQTKDYVGNIWGNWCKTKETVSLGTYTFVRTDEGQNGTLEAPGTLTYNDAPQDVYISYNPGANSHTPIKKIKYFLNSATTPIHESQNYCDLYFKYTVTSEGSYTFNSKIITACSGNQWIDGPNTTVWVRPACVNNTGPVVTSITGPGAKLNTNDNSYSVNANTQYTVQVSGVTGLTSNYDIAFANVGADGTTSDNTFVITKPLGSYSVSFTNKPGREQCPVIPPLQFLVGGNNQTIVEKDCPIALPDDLKNISSTDIVLKHFSGTIKSKSTIIVMPGVTLEEGAELTLLQGIPPATNDQTMNFTDAAGYDEYGRISSAGRTYFNKLGQPTQTQTKNLADGVILASQTIYDVYNRAAISTLTAPIRVREGNKASGDCPILADQGLNFAFKENFVKTDADADYDYKAYDSYLSGSDIVSKEENPVAISNSTPGTLGWYYSEHNGEANGTLQNLNEPLVGATHYPYSRKLFHHDGSGQEKGGTRPGDLFRAGAGHTGSTNSEPVLATDFYLSQYLDVYDEVYTRPTTLTGEFFRSVAHDEEGNTSMIYTDKSGKAIINLYFGKEAAPITSSYNIYDLLGRLKVSIPPNGAVQFKAPDLIPFADIDKTTYEYNYKGWLLKTNEKDAGTTNFVYRRDGKLRFSQNAQQLQEGIFTYINYDRSGRTVESGQCVGSFSFSESTLESVALDGGLVGVKSDQRFTLYGEPDSELPVQRQQRFVYGTVSKSSNSNSTTWYSYDEQGRVEWMVQNLNGFGVKTLDYRYGPTGAVQEVIYQKGKKDVENQADEQFIHYYTYDNNGRMSKAYTTTSLLEYKNNGDLSNSSALTLQASYYYYLHGPLKRIEYAGNVQGIDYVYTADGVLKSINDAVLANDPGKDGHGTSAFTPDVFGMTLDYYSGDYLSNAFVPSSAVTPTGTENQFTGLIKANRWHSPIQGNVPSGYAYRYDARKQMKDARWLTSVPGIVNPYYEHIYSMDKDGNEINGYDGNGNILSLNRKNKLGLDIANFRYHYIPNTNKLEKITTAPAPSQTNPNPALDNLRLYSYNAIGQMVEQEDAITHRKLKTKYDVSGKVTEVRDQDNKLITAYTYDDRGFRLSKTDYEGLTAKLKTWYVRDGSGNMVSTYEDNLTDAVLPKPVEMPVYGSSRIGLYKPQFGLTFYELMDQLGNVRAVIGDTITATYLATMENERSDKETDFIGINSVTMSTGMNHTPNNVEISEDEENTYIANPRNVIRINNGMDNPRNPIGGGLLLPVHPRDKIDAQVFVRYTDFDGGVDNTPLQGMASYLAQSFGAPVSVVDGVNIFRGLDETPSGVFSALGNTDDGLPLAFLTYVVYDRNMIPVLFDQRQAGTDAANGYQQLSFADIEIEKEGFIYIYVSNQSPQNMEVLFDDLKVVHHYSNIVAGGDYYPFGLEINDRRITREKHRFGYQGLHAEKDEETGWNHFELREYDPVIGRWLQKDPEGQFYSPYVGMGNNPISGVDPNGAYSLFGAIYRALFSLSSITYREVNGKRNWGYYDRNGEARYDSYYGNPNSVEFNPDYGAPPNIEIYGGVTIKAEVKLVEVKNIGAIKVVTPLVGVQVSANTADERGFHGDIIGGVDYTYLNLNVNSPTLTKVTGIEQELLDLRISPASGLSRGEWTPGFRALYTFRGDVLGKTSNHYAAKWKLQGDFRVSGLTNTEYSLGGRAVLETPTLLPRFNGENGIKFEFFAGFRVYK